MSIEFLILAPMQKELDPLRKELGAAHVQQIGPMTYYTSVPAASAPKIVIAEVGVGQAEAAGKAALAITQWEPKSVLLVGIAGGNRKEGVRFGDVLIPQRIYAYEYGKIFEDPDTADWRGVEAPVNARLHSDAKGVASTWIGDIRESMPASRSTGPATRFDGTVGSGDKVVSAQSFLDELAQRVSLKLTGVEMEAAAVQKQTHWWTPAPGFLMIRGVCDLANEHKNDKWHRYAAHVAAVFTRVFVSTQLAVAGPLPSPTKARRAQPFSLAGFQAEFAALQQRVAEADDSGGEQ